MQRRVGHRPVEGEKHDIRDIPQPHRRADTREREEIEARHNDHCAQDDLGGHGQAHKDNVCRKYSWNSTQKVFADLIRQELIYFTEEQGAGRAKKRYHLTDKGMNV